MIAAHEGDAAAVKGLLANRRVRRDGQANRYVSLLNVAYKCKRVRVFCLRILYVYVRFRKDLRSIAATEL